MSTSLEEIQALMRANQPELLEEPEQEEEKDDEEEIQEPPLTSLDEIQSMMQAAPQADPASAEVPNIEPEPIAEAQEIEDPLDPGLPEPGGFDNLFKEAQQLKGYVADVDWDQVTDTAGEFIANEFRGLGDDVRFAAASASDIVFAVMEPIANLFGQDLSLAREELTYDVEPLDDQATIARKVQRAVIAAVPEAMAFGIAGATGTAAVAPMATMERLRKYGTAVEKIGRGLGAGLYGAAREAQESDEAYDIVVGGMEFAALDAVLQATAVLGPVQRMTVMAGVFGGMARADGAPEEDQYVAAATGAILGALGRSKGLTGTQALGEAVKTSETYQKWKGNQQLFVGRAVEMSIEGANNYVKKNHPKLFRAMEIERRQIKTEASGGVAAEGRAHPNFTKAVGDILAKRLGLTERQAEKMPLRDKFDRLIKDLDPKGTIKGPERRLITDTLTDEINNQSMKLRALWEKDRVGPVPQATGNRKNVLRIIEDQRKMDLEQETAGRRFLDTVGEQLVDSRMSLRRRALTRMGDFGKRLVQMHDAEAGAMGFAQMFNEEFRRTVIGMGVERPGYKYAKLSKAEQQGLTDYIVIINKMARASKPGSAGKALARERPDLALQELSQRMGENGMRTIRERYKNFELFRYKAIDMLVKEGLMTGKKAQVLKNEPWLPPDLIRDLDPQVGTGGKGGRARGLRISEEKSTIEELHESGLKWLGEKELERAMRGMDVQDLMAQISARVISRIMRNKTRLAARDIAIANPMNGIFAVGDKPPEGMGGAKNWMKLTAKEGGKDVAFWIQRDYGNIYARTNPDLARSFAIGVRALSGNWWIRPLATGYNPAFAIVNFPRDLLHAWWVTNEYSPIAPMAIGQQARDLAATMKDAWLRTGRYREYVKEGGSMAFLTHQGQEGLIAPQYKGLKQRMHPKLLGTREFFSYLNETSEIWVRLALRERALRNGKTPEQATWEGRSYLDFSRGGRFAKGVDHMIPYLNAQIQATRGIGRAAKQHPFIFASKVGQTMGLQAMLTYTNSLINPEGYHQLTDYEKDNNWILMTPYYVMNPVSGDKQHMYVKIRKDQSASPFTSMMDMWTERWMFDRAPERSRWERVNQFAGTFFPIPVADTMQPVVEAYAAYSANYDLFFDSKIWGGRKVEPWMEYKRGGGRPTPAFWVELGKLTSHVNEKGQRVGGLSPVRAQAAVRKLLPHNTYTDFIGGGINSAIQAMSGDDPAYYQVQVPEKVWLENSSIRKVVSLTTPFAADVEHLDAVARQAGTIQEGQNKWLDEQYMLVRNGQRALSEVRREIRERYPQMEQNRIFKRLEDHRELDRIFRRHEESMPAGTNRRWWMGVKSLEPASRAQVLYERWRDAPQEEKGQMWSIARQLGFANDQQREFMREWNRLRREQPPSYPRD